jgi:hypothetical protein
MKRPKAAWLLRGWPIGAGVARPELRFVLVWPIALAGGVWLFAYVQHGTHDATHVGTRAGVVFIATLVQGSGPPESIFRGIDRFAGVSLGLLMLFAAMLLIGPPAPASGPGGRAPLHYRR